MSSHELVCSVIMLPTFFLPKNSVLAGELQVSKHWPTVVFCDPRGAFGLDSVGV